MRHGAMVIVVLAGIISGNAQAGVGLAVDDDPAFSGTASLLASSSADCPNNFAEFVAWRNQVVGSIQSQPKPSETRFLRDFWARCASQKPALFGNPADPQVVACSRNLRRYLNALAPRPDDPSKAARNNGFDIPTDQYLKDTREAVAISPELDNKEFLGLLEKGNLVGAKQWIETNLNSKIKNPADRFLVVPFKSAILPSGDSSGTFGRFLVAKGNKFMNFAVAVPGEGASRPQVGISVVAAFQAPDGTQKVAYRDQERDYSVPGHGRLSTNAPRQIGKGICTDCHRPAILQIKPEKLLPGGDEATLAQVNQRIAGLAQLRPYGKNVTDGEPPLGFTDPALLKARTPEFIKSCAGSGAGIRPERVAAAMNCATCHNEDRGLPLTVRPLLESNGFRKMARHWEMPPGQGLTENELDAAIFCMRQEANPARKGGPNTLAQWLKQGDCGVNEQAILAAEKALDAKLSGAKGREGSGPAPAGTSF